MDIPNPKNMNANFTIGFDNDKQMYAFYAHIGKEQLKIALMNMSYPNKKWALLKMALRALKQWLVNRVRYYLA